MAQVIWLPEALDDVERLYDFVYAKNPDAASRVAGLIIKGAVLLQGNQRLGRRMPDETDRRELFLAFGAGAYVLRYRLRSDQTVVIIRVWHSHEDR